MADRNYINDSLNYLADKVTYKKVMAGETSAFSLWKPENEIKNDKYDNGRCFYEKIGNFVHVHIAYRGFQKDISKTVRITASIPSEIYPPHTVQTIMNGGSRDKKAVVWITSSNFTETDEQKRLIIYGCSEWTSAIGDLYYFV